MTFGSWKSQIADGRVFELRTRSKRLAAPCALVVNSAAATWGDRMCIPVNRTGAGNAMYVHRNSNPRIYVEGLKAKHFTSARIMRRRRDLERFDADDIALLRYGLALDFSGKIHGNHLDINIPTCVPAEWTVFWLPAYAEGDDRFFERLDIRDELAKLLRGSWHFESYGGSRRLGYKFGHAWATRHTGPRLTAIGRLLNECIGGLIEQRVQVVRWFERGNVYTKEVRRECPAFGSRWLSIQTPNGGWSGMTL